MRGPARLFVPLERWRATKRSVLQAAPGNKCFAASTMVSEMKSELNVAKRQSAGVNSRKTSGTMGLDLPLAFGSPLSVLGVAVISRQQESPTGVIPGGKR